MTDRTVGLRGHRAKRSSDRAKRLFDVVAAGSALVALSPVLLVLAVIVRIKMGSPIIFRQVRPGLHGEPFTIYKFRSMVPETTGLAGERLRGVQRTPPFGARMRAMSLDELPELWNVLSGDMSLVGPRPLMMAYLPRYSREQARRHDVRPGITGLAQVNGRNAISWEEKFALDVKYVDSHDLRLDVSIILKTIRIVLSREGVRHAPDEDMPEFLGTEADRGADR